MVVMRDRADRAQRRGFKKATGREDAQAEIADCERQR
jgi:hypothetical protein